MIDNDVSKISVKPRSNKTRVVNKNLIIAKKEFTFRKGGAIFRNVRGTQRPTDKFEKMIPIRLMAGRETPTLEALVRFQYHPQ